MPLDFGYDLPHFDPNLVWNNNITKPKSMRPLMNSISILCFVCLEYTMSSVYWFIRLVLLFPSAHRLLFIFDIKFKSCKAKKSKN